MPTTIDVETDERVTIEDITTAVAGAVGDVDSGLCHVFVPHTTAGIAIQEAESNLLADIEATLADLVPQGAGYGHDRIDDNADAHLRSLLLDSSVTIPIQGGDLALGTWQRILFFEGDGPRSRRVTVTVVTP